MGRQTVSFYAGNDASKTITPDSNCQTLLVANEGSDTFTVAVTELDGDVKTLTLRGGTALELIFNPISSITITNASSSNFLVYFAKDAIENPRGYFKTADVGYPTNAEFGSSGTAGTVTIYPETASKGKAVVSVEDQTGDTQVTLSVNEMGQATTINFADPGASASYVAQSTSALTLAEVDKLDLSAQVETVVEAGAISVTKKNTLLDSTAGTFAATLAAPDATMYGLTKTIEMTVDGGDVTLALTNVQGGSAGTTATFADVNDCLVLVGGTSKWHVIGESGVTLA